MKKYDNQYQEDNHDGRSISEDSEKEEDEFSDSMMDDDRSDLISKRPTDMSL